MFHRSWAPGHNSSDYPRFYAAAPGEVYKIRQYQSAYEPYIVLKKDGPPWYALGSGDCIVPTVLILTLQVRRALRWVRGKQGSLFV